MGSSCENGGFAKIVKDVTEDIYPDVQNMQQDVQTRQSDVVAKRNETEVLKDEVLLKGWEAEAAKRTAKSFASQDGGEMVVVTVSNSDGTFTEIDAMEYSAKHWGEKLPLLGGYSGMPYVESYGALAFVDHLETTTVFVKGNIYPNDGGGGIYIYNSQENKWKKQLFSPLPSYVEDHSAGLVFYVDNQTTHFKPFGHTPDVYTVSLPQPESSFVGEVTVMAGRSDSTYNVVSEGTLLASIANGGSKVFVSNGSSWNVTLESSVNSISAIKERKVYTHFDGITGQAALPQDYVLANDGDYVSFDVIVDDIDGGYTETFGIIGSADAGIGFLNSTSFSVRCAGEDNILFSFGSALPDVDFTLSWHILVFVDGANLRVELSQIYEDGSTAEYVGTALKQGDIKINVVAAAWSYGLVPCKVKDVKIYTSVAGYYEVGNIFQSSLVQSGTSEYGYMDESAFNALYETKANKDATNLDISKLREALGIENDGVTRLLDLTSSIVFPDKYILDTDGDFIEANVLLTDLDGAYQSTLYIFENNPDIGYMGFYSLTEFWITTPSNVKLKWTDTEISSEFMKVKIIITDNESNVELFIDDVSYGKQANTEALSFGGMRIPMKVKGVTISTSTLSFQSDNLFFEDSLEKTNVIFEEEEPVDFLDPSLFCFVKKNDDGAIDIAIPTFSDHINYHMSHIPDANINSDVVRVSEISHAKVFYEDGFIVKSKIITNPGELETAIQEVGKSDFMGGNAHGDEEFTALSYFVDGVKVLVDDLLELTLCKKVEVHQTSNLFAVDTSKAIQNATAYKIWEFSKDGFILTQTIKWHQAIDLDATYLAMLPIYREQGGGVTTVGMRSPLYEEEDIAIDGHPQVITDSLIAKSYGIAGISAHVEQLIKPSTGSNDFFFSASPSYAKLYFDYSGTYATAVDELFESKTLYKIEAK